ncbi:IS110 family transposase [Chitinophaga sp. sic0106]|uniref:IS110 family transposase n=1 Tax=Chitinophaga sp. sic0106 TaxID=2854785 RepID=UPI001C470500|nr:IS110 family transposase [Chitinophaga sp. sic0106]MBV7534124.1 IS110 family transposase [Chitinophaga sp. sic0106]
METVVKQSIGLDIAKSNFTACIGKYNTDGSCILSKASKFDNTRAGFNQLLRWVRKYCEPSIETVYSMEATGIYYEALAYHLHELKLYVSVLLPNKVKHYAKSLNIKSKTDSIDAEIIARMGLERKLDPWSPPAPIFKQLRDLTRLYTDLKVEKTGFINRLKSIQSGHEPSAFVTKATEDIIKQLESAIVNCMKEIERLLASDPWLEEKVTKLLTIKGLGLITIAIILAETAGFNNIFNAKQLASYAGYDVVQRESGSSIKGITRISKKGNTRIRSALHFPSIVAATHNKDLKIVYQRINKGKASKMIGATALQRKILLLTYAMWKNNTIYRYAS